MGRPDGETYLNEFAVVDKETWNSLPEKMNVVFVDFKARTRCISVHWGQAYTETPQIREKINVFTGRASKI